MTLHRSALLASAAAALLITAGTAAAQAPASGNTDTIYGSQLMTRQERLSYREQLRAAKTAREREQLRQRHHEEMQLRARERGVRLPDMPPAGRGGPGPGPGPGYGPGPGPGPAPGFGPGPGPRR